MIRPHTVPVLEISGLSKSYGDLAVLTDLSVTVHEKEIVAMLGPSGCGKSTLLHIVAGLLCPDKGAITLKNRSITGKPGTVSYQQQKDLLLPWKTVIENVVLPLRIAGSSRRDSYAEGMPLLKRFGLSGFEEVYPGMLSGGMRQRVALLRTYLVTRSIMLLDEPFGALDSMTRTDMHEWLLGVLREMETSVLIVTHDIDEAILLADRVIVLSSRPARILTEIDVDLPRPRERHSLLSGKAQRLRGALFSAMDSAFRGSG